jgi:hypothetical protein
MQDPNQLNLINRFRAAFEARRLISTPPDTSPPKMGRVISPKPSSYIDKLLELEPIFVYLSRRRIPRNDISEIHEDAQIPRNTLYDWWRKLKRNSQWRPGLRASASRQALIHEQEELIASAIRDEFISMNRFCPPQYLNILAIPGMMKYDKRRKIRPGCQKG